MVWLAGTRIQSTWLEGGKKVDPWGTSLPPVGWIQETECNMQHGTWKAERDVTVGCRCQCQCRLKHIPRSLVAPGKQGPADLFINRYIHTCTNLCAPHLSLSMTLSTYLYNYTQWLGKASATPAAPNSIVKSNNYCHNLGLPGEGLLATPAGAKWISLNDFNRTELGLAESGIRSCHTCYLQQPVNRQPGFRLGDSESKLGWALLGKASATPTTGGVCAWSGRARCLHRDRRQGLAEPGVFTGVGGRVWQSQVSSQGSAASSGRTSQGSVAGSGGASLLKQIK